MSLAEHVARANTAVKPYKAPIRLGHILAEILKYTVLILVYGSFAFPLFWMISSALKNDPQVYTVPPILIPSRRIGTILLMAGPACLLPRLPLTRLCATPCPSPLPRWPLQPSWPMALPGALSGPRYSFLDCLMTMMVPWQVTMVPLFITFKNLDWINTYRPLVVPALFGHPYFISCFANFS